jgi:site-specific recombinase XerC
MVLQKSKSSPSVDDVKRFTARSHVNEVQRASTAKSFYESTIKNFGLWLQSKSYSKNSIRNYLSDINRFLNFLTDHQSLITDHYVIASYLQPLSTTPNYPRNLSSLNLFFKFLLDQKLIDHNPLKFLSRTEVLTGQCPVSTDISSNTNLVSTVPTEDCPPTAVLTRHRPVSTDIHQLIKLYQQHLEHKNKAPLTIKNYINDLKQYLDFYLNIAQ